MTMDSLQLFAVGKVKKDSGITTIEIYKEYADALLGLDQFSHVIVLNGQPDLAYLIHQRSSNS
ncbi:MAG: hypothetical protein U9N58_04805 [Thermodesulfobacteriota bacterium]|nr:hypothetical protein [Thermodesulfobacteriota bacterium]